jgi:DNA-directed RNA polymerase specialized sigma24 family protein
VAEGVEIQAADPFRYVSGVAHFVLKEVARQAERERAAAREFAPPPPANPQTETRLRCLDGCLEALPDEQRMLVVGYYEGEGSARITRRAELAERLGVDPNALRVRVHRLRAGLEDCLRRCVARQRT